MRICHIAYAFYESDNRIMRYAETLAARGDYVEVIALHHPGQQRTEVLHGVHVCRIQSRLRNEGRAWTYIFRILAFMIRASLVISWKHLRGSFDVIHVHSIPDVLVFSTLLPKLFGARVILDIHDILPEFYASKFNTSEGSLLFKALLLAERFSAGFADHVIIANHLWHERLIGRSVGPEKCTPIINAPDTRIFTRRRRERKDDRFILIYPGSLNQHQGLDIAVRAVARACAVWPQIEMHIHGEGPAREQLIELSKECGAEHNIRFFPLSPLRDIVVHIANADLGIVPKRADSFGNEAFSTKILEFMCGGLPVLVSATKIDRFYFNDSVVTFFESGNEDELFRCILRFFRDRRMGFEQAERANNFVKNLTWDVYKPQYLEMISSLLSSSRSLTLNSIHPESRS